MRGTVESSGRSLTLTVPGRAPLLALAGNLLASPNRVFIAFRAPQAHGHKLLTYGGFVTRLSTPAQSPPPRYDR
jgi:hypothetical protein